VKVFTAFVGVIQRISNSIIYSSLCIVRNCTADTPITSSSLFARRALRATRIATRVTSCNTLRTYVYVFPIPTMLYYLWCITAECLKGYNEQPVLSQNSINALECQSYISRVLAGILALPKDQAIHDAVLVITLTALAAYHPEQSLHISSFASNICILTALKLTVFGY